MFCICLPHQRGLSVNHTNTKLDMLCILGQTRPPLEVDALALIWIIGIKCLFQRHNDTLPKSETEQRVDNLAVANLHFYPLSCTAVGWNDSVKCFS